MPTDADFANYIKELLACYHLLCKKTFVRLAFKTGIGAITTHAEMINVTSEDGKYWGGIDNTTQKDFIIQSNLCLSEVLLDFSIKEVASLMFCMNKDFNQWSKSVKTFAFGS